VLSPGATAIGDFNMIDATTALVIERDNGEGTSDKACPAGQRAENCFHDLAKFKRVVKIEMNDANVNAPVRKIAYVDLMKIQDPQGKARKPSRTWTSSMAATSSWATTTTCRSPPRASPTGLTTTNSSSWRLKPCSRPAELRCVSPRARLPHLHSET
jgi:hypothetical protein